MSYAKLLRLEEMSDYEIIKLISQKKKEFKINDVKIKKEEKDIIVGDY